MGGKLSMESRSSLPPLSSGNHYVIEEEQQYRQQSPLPPPAASSSYSQAPSGYSHAPPPRSSGKRLSRKYSHITDQFTNVEQVQQALGQAGLESSNLIVGIDFTKSNEWTGVTHFLYTSLILL
jgi:E3 ubiquitin-protein ligase RGLG